VTAPLADDVAIVRDTLCCSVCERSAPVYDLVCARCLDALGGGPALVRLRAVADAARAYRAAEREWRAAMPMLGTVSLLTPAQAKLADAEDAARKALDAALAALEAP
jgi:hypothetical protein